jgi:WD40 repeat protein
MSDAFRYDVFLSYSHNDKEAARGIAKRLRAAKLRVWFDGPGTVENSLERSRALVLCLSANAFGPDWDELESRTRPFRDPLNNERRFIPLRLDSAPLDSPLAQFLAIDWQTEPEKLVEACRPTWTELRGTDERRDGRFLHLELNGDVYCAAFSLDGRLAMFGSNDSTVRLWDLESRRELCVLKGHSNSVHSVAFSPDGRRALSGANDKTVRLWDVESGLTVRVLKGHGATVYGVAFSPDGRCALSGSEDGIVRLWDAESGRALRLLEGHSDWVRSVAFSPDGRCALSGADDKTVRLWDLESGRVSRVLQGHSGLVYCVAFSPDGHSALSGSSDKTVRLWDVESGRALRLLEGHSDLVLSVAFSKEGGRALSGSMDTSVRLWDLETGSALSVLQGHSRAVWGVAFGLDGRHALSGSQDNTLLLWDLESGSAAPAPQVRYTNAKVLLVGDTGVGKSGLAERLVHKRFVPTKSSHARKAYVLNNEVVTSRGGVPVQQETLLWDLAGQPAYRLVHQLSLDDAALACVLFDSRSETNPFEGAAYWSKVLDQARTNTKLKKLLIASRIDVGGLPAGRDRIEEFARESRFDEFLATSAMTGEGCDELLDAIRRRIPWDELPTVTTTKKLAALREYVAQLRGEKDGRHSGATRLFTVAELHEGFCASFGEKISLDEFIAHLERLEATDVLDLLVFHTTGAEPRPEHLVLLDPTRVDAYASALLVAAKDEPEGPGSLLEWRVREGKFKLEAEERLSDADSERHLLWHVIESLLARDLALRERIKGEDYIVFPSQCTAELRFPGAAAFGVAFGFAGPVRSVYATLIAQLAHYEGFKKREFYQDAAAYRAEAGGLCLIRLRDQERGEGELDVLFDKETAAPVRQGFLEFVRKHLNAKSTPGTLTERHAYHCLSCANPFEDRVVKARLEARRKNLICPICEKKTPLVDLLAAPTQDAESVAAQIGADAAAGRQRMTAALVIKAKEAEGKFDVFLSYNSKDKAAVEKIARQLLKVGIRPWLDKWNLAPGDTVMDELGRAIKNIPCATLCFGSAGTGKWHTMEIRGYVDRWAGDHARVIPVILPGGPETPELPPFVSQILLADMRDWESEESDAFYRLVCGILGRAPGDSPMRRFSARHVFDWQSKH